MVFVTCSQTWSWLISPYKKALFLGGGYVRVGWLAIIIYYLSFDVMTGPKTSPREAWRGWEKFYQFNPSCFCCCELVGRIVIQYGCVWGEFLHCTNHGKSPSFTTIWENMIGTFAKDFKQIRRSQSHRSVSRDMYICCTVFIPFHDKFCWTFSHYRSIGRLQFYT